MPVGERGESRATWGKPLDWNKHNASEKRGKNKHRVGRA
jgi:hypothetical protein